MIFDSVAQLVEQMTLNHWVESSSLSGVTSCKRFLNRVLRHCRKTLFSFRGGRVMHLKSSWDNDCKERVYFYPKLRDRLFGVYH